LSLHYSQALIFVIGIVITMVNFALSYLIQRFTRFCRYETVAQELTSQFTKMFIAQFINTAVIQLIIQADIFGFRPINYVTSIIP